MICQRLGELPILVLALSMMSTIDEVLADLYICLKLLIPSYSLVPSQTPYFEDDIDSSSS